MKAIKLIKCIIITIIGLAVALLLYFVFVPWSHEPGFRSKAQLIVNNQQIGESEVWIYQHGDKYFSDLPLTSVIGALGYPVKWMGNDTAQIVVNDKTYIINDGNINDNSGKTISRREGLFASTLGMGGPPKEIYYEIETLKIVLPKMGIENVNFKIDLQSKTVIVNQEKS